jgi:putative membrane protein
VLAPLARNEEVDRILAEFGWRSFPSPIEWQRVSKAFVWMRAIALSPIFLLAGLQTAVLGMTPFLVDQTARGAVWPYLAPLLIPTLIILGGLAITVLVRWLAWRRTGYAIDGDRLLVRTGWWQRKVSVLPTAKIQSVDLRESFISRLFGIASLQFGVAGGGMTGHSIPAIPREEARKLRDLLLDLET